MRRFVLPALLPAVLALQVFVYAQSQLSIRAGSTEPVAGWERMQFGKRAVWVSPVVSLTSNDIAAAQQTTADGRTAVGISLNDAGARKMRELSLAQKDKLIVILLDREVIFAPLVRSEIGSRALITGPAPSGLSATVVQRILSSVQR